MKGCKDIQRVLGTYRDASAEERAVVDTHIATCAGCARDLASFSGVDALLSAAPNPTLPPRLSRPFAALLEERAAPQAQRSGFGIVSGRSLAPAAAVVLLLVALSVLLWSVNESGAPVSSTPTLTSTLTPTTIAARETGPALAAIFTSSNRPVLAPAFVPTPGPAPAPGGNLGSLFAGPPAHATITH